jgi:hypothetical protein
MNKAQTKMSDENLKLRAALRPAKPGLRAALNSHERTNQQTNTTNTKPSSASYTNIL